MCEPAFDDWACKFAKMLALVARSNDKLAVQRMILVRSDNH